MPANSQHASSTLPDRNSTDATVCPAGWVVGRTVPRPALPRPALPPALPPALLSAPAAVWGASLPGCIGPGCAAVRAHWVSAQSGAPRRRRLARVPAAAGAPAPARTAQTARSCLRGREGGASETGAIWKGGGRAGRGEGTRIHTQQKRDQCGGGGATWHRVLPRGRWRGKRRWQCRSKALECVMLLVLGLCCRRRGT